MKYKLTDEKIEHNGKMLYRIQALKDFGNVKAGDLGGYIELERNLSHDGNCWVFDDARISDNAWVSDEALVFDNALVFGNAWVFGDVWVSGEARVSGNTRVYGNTKIKDGYIG
jgi:hypothetical protein